jgi:hypothetical protein
VRGRTSLDMITHAVVLLLLAFARDATAERRLADVAGERCAQSLPTPQNCRATRDIMFVIDRSYSRQSTWSDIKAFIKQFAQTYALATPYELSPRLGIVAFDGANPAFTTDASTYVASELTTSALGINQAVDTIPTPLDSCGSTGGCTCISCGLEKAWDRILNAPIISGRPSNVCRVRVERCCRPERHCVTSQLTRVLRCRSSG